uniref:Uncharacterized protein n=1 Tax=Tanacetum cinerariifolium TaxID=118510 RepID=A0A699JL62_TANCI|nr:hypothetical protein [Tanacetum cinerariifolium]
MVAPVISISSDSSDESVGSSILQVILFGFIPIEVPVVPADLRVTSEVGAAAVTSLAERHVSSAPHDAMVSRWRSRVASRPSSASGSLSPTTSTSEIPTAPILPAPPTIVTPSIYIISPIFAPPGVCRRRAILIQPGQDILVGRLYRTYPSGPCRALTARKTFSSLGTEVHIKSFRSLYFLFIIRPFIIRPFISKPFSSISCFRSPTTTVPSFIPDSRALYPTRVDLLPPHKRFRDSYSSVDSIEEDIDANVLENIKDDVAVVEAIADIDVEAGVDTEVGVDVVARIDIPVGNLMPDDVEHLDQVEEVVQGIYGYIMEIPL